MIDEAGLAEQAQTVLQGNDRGAYTVPAQGIYPHQWLWDSCFIAIGLRHIDIARAQSEVLHLFRGQWKNGMLPHIILAPGTRRDRHQHTWQSWLSPLSPDDVSTSGITQPPMLAEAIVRIGEKLTGVERRNWYRRVWPNLLAYHTWLYGDRDPHGEGLVLLIHPWESGMDNTPPWIAELNQHLLPGWIRIAKRLRLEHVVGLLRTDTRHVPAAQRTSNLEALALYDAQLRLRRNAYDIDKVLDHSLFAIEDLAFNCILLRANTHLRSIARALHEELPKDLSDHMELAEKALDALWDQYTEQYYSRDFTTHRLLKEPSIAAFMPLYAGAVSKERAEGIVKLLENEKLFGTPYPVPSVPVNSAWFNPSRYWQGPTWVNMNWLIIDGLERYGFKDHARALKESTIEMVTRHGFREYFHPRTGEGLGAKNFSWTAALTIDLLKS